MTDAQKTPRFSILEFFIMSVAVLAIVTAVLIASKGFQPLVLMPDSMYESADYINDNQAFIKDKRDLIAQEGMWRAANYLVLLTLLQLIVGGFTALYLVLTFRTQRSELRAAVRTAKMAEESTRPMILVHLVGYDLMRDSTHQLSIDIKNMGNVIGVVYSVCCVAKNVNGREGCVVFASDWEETTVNQVACAPHDEDPIAYLFKLPASQQSNDHLNSDTYFVHCVIKYHNNAGRHWMTTCQFVNMDTDKITPRFYHFGYSEIEIDEQGNAMSNRLS